ncbi:MAG: AAA family ATPase, partial [Pseudomonas sp.]
MSGAKQLWVLTGGNGAGKSTFFRLCLEPRGMAFINADQIARDIDPEHPEQASYEAARLAALLRDGLLREGRSFCYETVFSHPS